MTTTYKQWTYGSFAIAFPDIKIQKVDAPKKNKQQFRKVIETISVNKVFKLAVEEWRLLCEIPTQPDYHCICGHSTPCRQAIARNILTGDLAFIGTSCIVKFLPSLKKRSCLYCASNTYHASSVCANCLEILNSQMTFGQYAQKTVSFVMQHDKNYLLNFVGSAMFRVRSKHQQDIKDFVANHKAAGAKGFKVGQLICENIEALRKKNIRKNLQIMS